MATIPVLPSHIDIAASDDEPALETGANVGAYRPRTVYGVLTPTTVDDVQTIARCFAESSDAPPLHALSTGRNWGLGSKEPATDGVVRVDMAGLDRMRQIDTEHGWAVVEPGVTQLQLADALTGTDRMLNVTASSGYTSIVGNMLDRGVGLYGPRIEDLLGLEVVLPDGNLLKVGWWPREDGTSPAINVHGLGPSLLGLFSQSNLAIVTTAVVRLHPRPAARRTLSLTIAEGSFARAVDALRGIALNGLNRGVIKIYDGVANESYGGGSGAATALLNVEGTPASVEAISGIVKDDLMRSGAFDSYADSTDETLHGDTVFDVVHAAFGGDPSQNEKMLRSAVGVDADAVDAVGGGWLFFLPYVPFDGPAIQQARELLQQVYKETGVVCGSTVNALNGDVIDLVVTIRFRRAEQQTARAHRALDRLYELFTAHGFLPYRLDVDHAAQIDAITANSGTRDLQRQLKSVLDSQRVIAPGRYA